ncbi:hypothetical protein A2996_00240 [Candidatus Campbellbacteria bacterium RIFCSPLOWO2_01_FULL_34_15]|uniref:Uncharacterized protein n=1 Tax=Candidatus Campbellbacteria bacterium RIFCSPLOWO2_01_FULL_34_15 TaxID=1797579 RepID=A0A1F5EML6_9BACT|nr:MAG: hypothetical protein A2996_00240 [Candidatus Campbellbacteria bacterium RIFCSPLOWO2_01_FULL_34_15]
MDEINVLLQEQYIEVLEKTNEQLSLFPYDVIIGTLSFLVTFLTIVFAWYLYKQSVDYQKRFDGFIKELRRTFDEELKKNSVITNDKIDEFIKKREAELKDTTGKAREKIEEEIKEIREIKKNLNRSPLNTIDNIDIIQPISGVRNALSDIYNNSSISFGSPFHFCNKCGNTYSRDLENNILSMGVGFSHRSICPSCGNVN